MPPFETPAAAAASAGYRPAGASADADFPEASPPPAGHLDPSRTVSNADLVGGVRGEGPAADSDIRSSPAAGQPQTLSPAVETGHDIGGLFNAEMFPQHTK